MAWPTSTLGQLCVTSHTTDLFCLIPATFHTETAPFNAILTAFGTQLGELPTARPAGLVLRFEHGQLVPANESLGVIFSERAETLGRHRAFVGFTYQNFTFDRVDGLDLKQLPIVLYDPVVAVATVTQSRFDIRVGQYTANATYGLTNRVDVSVAVPFERVGFAATVNGQEFGPGGGSAPVAEHVPGHASGLADVIVGAKALALERRSVRVAGGVDVRLPTGDELNLLGSGATGVRPYLVASRGGRLSPHLNAGYQWNARSILNTTVASGPAPGNGVTFSAAGDKQNLPGDLFFTAGANLEASAHWTLVADVLGRHFFDAPRLATATVTGPAFGTAANLQPYVGGYTTTDLSLGFKSSGLRRLIVTGNVTLKLNEGGLRARAVPLGGLSYTF